MIESLMFIQQVLFGSIFIAIYEIKICKVAKTCFVGFPIFLSGSEMCVSRQQNDFFIRADLEKEWNVIVVQA